MQKSVKMQFSENEEVWGCLKTFTIFSWASESSFICKYEFRNQEEPF